MSKLALIGAGPMSEEYAKVLTALDIPFEVFGRGAESAKIFSDKTGRQVNLANLSDYYQGMSEIPSLAIVAVTNSELAKVACELVKLGVKRILLEKPGAINFEDLQDLHLKANIANSTILIGFNRRFYSSTLAAEKIIQSDGGLTSIRFQFTEWVDKVLAGSYSKAVLQKWMLSNPIHVLDLFIYFAGRPSSNSSYLTGSSDWHQTAMQFCGGGVTDKNIIYSYHADWDSAGRWSVELYTQNRKLILCPMENLQEVKKFSISVDNLYVDDVLDTQFKPGLYRQVRSFIDADDSRFCSLEEQLDNFKFYYQLAGYKA